MTIAPVFPRTPPLGWASDYIAAPWVWDGRDPDTGVDCFGLLVAAYAREFGIKIEDLWPRRNTPDGAARTAFVLRGFKEGRTLWQAFDRPLPGVAVLMLTRGVPAHVGLCVSPFFILHADQEIGEVVMETVADLRPRIVGFYLPPGISLRAAA